MKKWRQGISLIEILVVVAIFAILGIIITRSIFLTLQGSKKSATLVNVRENVDHAMGIIERNLRNANSISECPNSDPAVINYIDQNGKSSSFSCKDLDLSDSYIASGSARLTSNTIKLVGCSFTCVPGTSANPPSVIVNIEAQDAVVVGAQGGDVTTTTQIFLRNY